jgi:hypothetical protein
LTQHRNPNPLGTTPTPPSPFWVVLA